jgi:SpoVK/Ycf46/Vps4 family AAA+-type ATPase
VARADLIADLVATGMAGDRTKFRKVVDALIAEERAKNHLVLAEKLQELLGRAQTETNRVNGTSLFDQRVDAFVFELIPERKLEQLILPPDVVAVVKEVIVEHHRVDLLRSYNLEPRNRLLFLGPPGNGKTSLAEAMAEALMVPLLQVRYDGIVGAYLGETAVRLRRLLEFASKRKCLLFFDEFETLGKERGDTHDTGEIKRVVSSLLMQVDGLPSHVVVIGATNHPELLDRAVWRRFQVRIELPQPTRASLAEWFTSFERRINRPLGHSPDALAKRLSDVSFAEAEEFAMSAFRKFVLGQPESDIKATVDETLKTWKARSVRRTQEDGGES